MQHKKMKTYLEFQVARLFLNTETLLGSAYQYEDVGTKDRVRETALSQPKGRLSFRKCDVCAQGGKT